MWIATALGAFALVAPNDAQACAGGFSYQQASTVEKPVTITGHRMAIKIGRDETILWDQMQFTGQPEEFAWIGPVRAGSQLELSDDAFFQSLESKTSVTVAGPVRSCYTPPAGGGEEGGGCCSVDGETASPGEGVGSAGRGVDAGVQ